MYFIKKLIMGMLSFLLISGCLAGAIVAKESKAKEVSINVTSDATLIPGQGISVNVGILNTSNPPEKGDIQSATIVLNYDENIFTTDEDEVLRFDETLGKYIWRDDTFTFLTTILNQRITRSKIQNPQILTLMTVNKKLLSPFQPKMVNRLVLPPAKHLYRFI